jgi:tetratricopeptide (TPR) repeat protein
VKQTPKAGTTERKTQMKPRIVARAMFQKARLSSGVFLAALLFVTASYACGWDRDTLADEQRGLPDMTAIIVGRYERHTREFYLRRIAQARAALATADDKTARLLMDDIAVAQDKVNRDALAIEVMRDKMKRFGVDYRAAANIGTFYAHAGDLKNAEMWISRAVKINPNAHFGREWVQLRAIRYFQAIKMASPGEPRPNFWDARFSTGDIRVEPTDQKARLTGALEGLAGLIKIGDRKVPELYAALADALAARGDLNLAAFSLWRAMELGGTSHPQYERWRVSAEADLGQIYPRRAPENLLQSALRTLRGQAFFSPLTGAEKRAIRDQYDAQREYADRWLNAYQNYEVALIKVGKDPEKRAHFAPFYKQWLTPQQAFVPPPARDFSLWPIAVAALLSLGILAVGRKRYRRSLA